MSRFGTARVQINVDDKLSLASSSLDLLLPVHDTEKHLLFTQGSIHRTDDRNQANLGVGVRRFNDDYMVGVNSFFDHDLSRSHSRLGVGVEYWRDYLKLSANGYHRLSNWRTSPDVVDYEERPANGWDVRAEGWLPSMPQLGGKLAYEKYYGSEVGLFGKDNRKKNPHAVTTGVTYTPIPLLTFSAEQRRGDAGASDTQFGMQFNWNIGQSWSKQTDPNKVAAMRTLAGSRYDLVERNNNIVLEYRKKEVIRLNVARQLAGAGGERKSLQVTVQSKYGLERIDWSAATLLQAGGKIEHLGGSDYQLTLPFYRSGAQAVNTYTLHGVAVDKQGNRSNRSETQVTVNAPVFDAARSTFLPTDSVVPTNGGVQVVTLTVRDGQDGLIDVPLSDLKLAVTRGTASTGAKVSDFSRKSVGVYEVTVTAGTLPETLTLRPSIQNTALTQANISIMDRVPDAGTSAFKVTPSEIDTSGTTVATLTLTANDADGNPVPDIADQLTFIVKDAAGTSPGTGITIGQVTETTAGSYTARLSGTKAGVWTVTPQYKGTALGALNGTVKLVAGPIAAVRSTVTAVPNAIEAGSGEISVLTLTAKDAEDNPITGIADKLSFRVKSSSGSDAGSDITLTAVTESAPGVYKANLSGTKADTWTVTPLFESNALGILADVVLTPGAVDAGTSDFTANPISIVVGAAESELKFNAKDAKGNPVSGLAKDLSFAVQGSTGAPVGSDVTITPLQETTPGTYTAKLSGTKADVWTVTPQLKGTALTSLAADVTLLAGALDTGHSLFTATPDKLEANNKDSSTLEFVAKDAKENPLTGLTSKLTFSVKNDKGENADAGVTIENLSETVAGTYTATLKGSKADTWTVEVLLDSAATGMSDKVILTPGAVDAGTSKFSANPDTIAANKVAKSDLTFNANDAQGNPLSGIAADLTFDVRNSAGDAGGSDVTVEDLKETTPGTYTATLSGTKSDVWTVTPQVNGTALTSLATDVTLVPGALDTGRSVFTVNPKTIEANGSDNSTIELIAKDAKDNPLIGLETQLSFTVKNGLGEDAAAGVTIENISETAAGTNTATLKGTKADTWTVELMLDGTAVGLSDTVELTTGAVDASKSTLLANPDRIEAGGTEKSELTFTARDAHDNPIKGLIGNLVFDVTGSGSAASGDVTVEDLKETTPGTYTAKLSGAKADVWTVTPQVKGTAIGGLTTKVTVVPGALDTGRSSVTVTPDAIVANDIDTSTLEVIVKDAKDNPITGLEGKLTFRAHNEDGQDASTGVIFGSVNVTAAGTYTATVKGSKADTWTVEVWLDGTATGMSDKLILTPDAVDAGRSSVSANPATIAVGGSEKSMLEFIAQDAKGNLIKGLVGDLVFDVTDSSGGAPSGNVIVEGLQETTPGTYTAMLSGTKADVWTVTPKLKGAAIGSLKTEVTLKAGAVDAGKSNFQANPVTIDANNADSSTLTFVAKDAEDNPVTGLAAQVTFSAKDSGNNTAGVTVGSTSEDAANPGTYTATLTGTKADVWTVTPKLAGIDLSSLTEKVTLVPGAPDATTSSFDATPARIDADGSTPSTLKFTALDANKNPISGIAAKLMFKVEGTGGIPAPGEVDIEPIVEDGTTGVYTAKLRGTLVGTYTVTPQADTVSLDTLATSVELFKAGPPADAYSKIEVSKDRVYADGVEQTEILFTAMDASNQPVSGIEDQISFQVQDNGTPVTGITLSAITEKGNTGVYSATLEGTAVGKFKVVPLVEGKELNISEPVELFTSSFEKFRNDYGWEYKIPTSYPQTGYEGAKFTVLLSNNDNPDDYDWTSDAPWLTSRGAGTFEFTAAPTGARLANITAQRKGSPIKHDYQINNKRWFYVSSDSIPRNPSTLEDECNAKGMVVGDSVRYAGGLGFPGVSGFLNEWGSIAPNIADNYFALWDPLNRKWVRIAGTYDDYNNGTPVGVPTDPTRLICMF
ncbi:invasin domain 3-containing protein [Pseudomonas putida]|uniref:invasin domain 3-containing protein n=1 Tax=Pseudomonas putida TaxID=303 RepID=UPI00265F787D|nr:invasin domain 3-containing protein [Pseudomonas putida]